LVSIKIEGARIKKLSIIGSLSVPAMIQVCCRQPNDAMRTTGLLRHQSHMDMVLVSGAFSGDPIIVASSLLHS